MQNDNFSVDNVTKNDYLSVELLLGSYVGVFAKIAISLCSSNSMLNTLVHCCLS